MNSNFLSFMSEHLLKMIKRFRTVYLKFELQDLCLSEGENQGNGEGGPKQQGSGSGHIQNNTVLFPARSWMIALADYLLECAT